VVVPLVSVVPEGVHQIEQFGTALYQGSRTPSLYGQQTVFAGVVPEAGRHARLLAGNDTIFGDAGNDRLIGDHSIVIAPFQIGMEGMLDQFDQAMGDLGLIDRRLPPQLTKPIPLASDCLDDGGDDQLVGDSQVLLAAGVGASPLAAEELMALPFRPVLTVSPVTATSALRRVVVGPLVDQLVLQGANDTLEGGAGNDKLIGDHDVVVAGIVTGPVLVAGATVLDPWDSA